MITAWVGDGVAMKSRTSATLRIRAICEYTILRLLHDHVFLSGCDVFFAVFSYPRRVLRMEPS